MSDLAIRAGAAIALRRAAGEALAGWGAERGLRRGRCLAALVGEKVLGFVEHGLHPDGSFATRLARVPGLPSHDIREISGLNGSLPRLAQADAA